MSLLAPLNGVGHLIPPFSAVLFFSSVHCSGCEDSILIFV